MSETNFCAKCGAKRLEDSRFCHQCGQPFEQVGGVSHQILWILAIAMCGTLVLYPTITWLSSSKATRTEDVAHRDDHNHAAHDNERTIALKKEAEDREPRAVMTLVNYLIEQAGEHPEYLDQAATYLTELLGRFPDFDYGLRLLGGLYYEQQKVDEAITYYRLYLKRQPNDANIHTDLGTLLLAAEDVRGAIAQYRLAIDLHPDFYHAHFNLSLALNKAGDKEGSVAEMAKAEAIKARIGQRMAPDIDLPRLPEGVEPVSVAAASASKLKDPIAELETFFRRHPIIGPKMDRMEQQDQKAVLWVRDFPMSAMPPVAKQAFERKILDQLASLDSELSLEIRDVVNREVMATYGGE